MTALFALLALTVSGIPKYSNPNFLFEIEGVSVYRSKRNELTIRIEGRPQDWKISRSDSGYHFWKGGAEANAKGKPWVDIVLDHPIGEHLGIEISGLRRLFPLY